MSLNPDAPSLILQLGDWVRPTSESPDLPQEHGVVVKVYGGMTVDVVFSGEDAATRCLIPELELLP